MKIGIDLRALQTGHKFRGIGEVAKQVTNRLLEYSAKDGHQVIFYEYDDDDPKELLDIPASLQYEVIKVGLMPENNPSRSMRTKIKQSYDQLYGVAVPGSRMSDVFVQYDYAFGVPKNTKTLLLKHDLIPLIFWDDFFESPMVPFRNFAARTTLRTILANHKYKRLLKRGVRNAYKIITPSKSTRADLIGYLKAPSDKIKVIHHGIAIKPTKTNEVDTPKNMPTKPYLLFVGAADQRRRLEDLVDAYNNVKADGHDIQLVLVGENFKSYKQMPEAARKSVLASSYKADILPMGYVDDVIKQKLFKESLAFVYPTKYEGFGIPPLEAFMLGAPVITYKNSSLPEVGGDYAIFVNDWWGIKIAIEDLITEKASAKKARVEAAKKWAENFSWDKTAKKIYKELLNLG